MMHQICVNHIDGNNFICKNCNFSHFGNEKKAADLRHTILSEYIEKRLNNYLRLNDLSSTSDPIIIRNLFAVKKCTAMLPRALQWYRLTKNREVQYSYRSKGIFAFQNQNGDDVCFFAMYCQEYSNCPDPNYKCVYISYLDTVNVLNPKHIRTKIYQQIILGYLEYAKTIGFKSVHLWSCPPTAGMDYIFYKHPSNQKYPTQSKLNKWYRTLLDLAVEEGILTNYSDLFTYAVNKKIKEFPYFDGDLLPGAFEIFCGNNPTISEGELLGKIMAFIQKQKNNLLVGTLNNVTGNIMDADPLISCNVINERGDFLTFAFSRYLEFSSVRRAKFSTLSLLHILYDSEWTFVCKSCNQLSDFAFQCEKCNTRIR